MKKIVSISLALLLLGALFMSCGSAPVSEYSDPAKTIEVSVGGQFIIALDGNATTGYQWVDEIDKTILKQVNSEYKVNESKPGMVGVGGKQRFTYQAIKAGSTQVTVTYKRSWETTSAEQKVFKVTVK